jgi:transcription elongation factor GreA-like protein
MGELEKFFEGLRVDDVLLFTTFTLDEAVLVALLDKYHVHKDQRVVVFHDILRHRCPGILKSYYPNAMVYTVELTQSYSQRCPVFHSKIWARLSNNTINKLVITSANLSQYHLVTREGSGTFESFQWGNIQPQVDIPQTSVTFKRLAPN